MGEKSVAHAIAERAAATRFDQLDTKVSDGDVISILPAVAGG